MRLDSSLIALALIAALVTGCSAMPDEATNPVAEDLVGADPSDHEFPLRVLNITGPPMPDPVDIATFNRMRNEWIAAFAAGNPEPVDFMFTRDAIFEPFRPTAEIFDQYDAALSFTNEGNIQNGDNWVSYRSDYTLALTPKTGGETVEHTGRFYTKFRRWEDGVLAPIRGPNVGEEAPNFALNYMSGGEGMELNTLRGKPTVLLFGSYT